MCYGHDAELLISGNRVFVEWNGEKIELFHVVGDTCNKLCELSDITKIDTVKMLFDTSIFEKTLNNDYKQTEKEITFWLITDLLSLSVVIRVWA